MSPGQPDHPAGAALLPAGRGGTVRHHRPRRAQEPEPARLQPVVAVVANTSLGRSSTKESPVVRELLIVLAGRVVSGSNTQSGAQPRSWNNCLQQSDLSRPDLKTILLSFFMFFFCLFTIFLPLKNRGKYSEPFPYH